jgi:hypothetical protein
MSDIWIKKSNTNPKWAKATAIHIKRFSGATTKWFAAKVIWIKNTSSGWLRVWPTSGVFAETDPYITTTSSGSTPLYGTDNVIRIGTTYYGRNGTWNANGFTISSYTYTWPYYSDAANQPGDYDLIGNLGTGVYSSPSRALTISTLSDASAADGNYISFKITANASNALYSNTADSKDTYGKIKVIRRTPINISFGITGTASVGSTLSVGSAWNTTEAYKPDAARSTIYWYRSSSNTSIYNGQGRTQITSASGSYSYVVQSEDLGSYIIAEETVFNTGSDYDIGVGLFTNGLNQVTAVSSIVADTTPQAFNTISYVKNFPSSGSGGVVRTTSLSWNASTNATRYEIEYEGSYDNSTWTTVQSFAASPYTSSTSQSVSWGSPRPSGGFDYYTYMRARVRASNTSTATTVIGDGGSYIYASGTAPGQPTFGTITTGSTTASIPVTAGTQGSNFLYSPAFEYQYRASSGSYSGTWISSSSPISLTGLSGGTTYYIKIRTRNYDELVSPENETSFSIASNLTPPSIFLVTAGNSSGQPVTVYFTGGSGPYYQIWWTTGVGGTLYDEYGSSSPITDNTGPTSASTAWFAYVRSVSSPTNTGIGPSPTISEWSTGYQFTVTQAPIIPTISMSANSNITQTSGTINWTSTNQSSFSSNGTFSGTGTTGTSISKSGLAAGTTYTGTVTVTSSTGNTASANYSLTTSAPAPVTPAITSGPFISWGSGNNFTLSATASNATNIEFQVQYANTNGGTVQNTVTYFMGASAGSRTTGAQSYPWARTRARANNTSTGLSSAFTGYTAWA